MRVGEGRKRKEKEIRKNGKSVLKSVITRICIVCMR